MKKILTKAVAALASAVTLSSMAGAIPTSAINITTVKNSAFQYTVTTNKVSANKFQVVFRVLKNPGVQSFSFAIQSDESVQYDGEYDYGVPDDSFSITSPSEDGNRLFCVFLAPVNAQLPPEKNVTYATDMTFTFEYEVKNNATAEHIFKVGVVQYYSPVENVKFTNDSDDPLTDADVSISPSVNVRLGDIDSDNCVDAIDLFYVEKMLSESNNQLSTTYLDQQLKNRNSTWSKNYPFLKCAAVADIDHNTLIQKADSDSLGKYIAEKGAGVVLTNKEINTLFPVTVVYEN